MLCCVIDTIRRLATGWLPCGWSCLWLPVVPLLPLAPLVWKHGPPALRYYARMASYYLLLTASATVVLPTCFFPRPRRPENMLRGARLMTWVSRSILGWRFDLQAPSGALSRDEAFVVVVNHQHSIDVLALFALWPYMHRCTTLAKSDLLLAGPFGPVAWLCGTTFINRKNRKKAYQILLDAVRDAKSTRTKVLVFPEGTRNHVHGQRELLPFRKGAFAAAIVNKGAVPWLLSVFTFRAKMLHSGRAVMKVLEPIPTADLTEDNVDSLMEETRSKMLYVYQSLGLELET